MRINKSITFCFLSLGASCSSMFHVIDNYIVCNEYDNNQLDCNPAYKDSPFVEYVKSVMWNSNTIVVNQQLPNGHHNWFFVIAKCDTLHCHCQDSLLGPFSQEERDSILSVRGIDTLKMERKVWRTPY